MIELIFKGFVITKFSNYILISKDNNYSSVSKIISFGVYDTYIYIYSINNEIGLTGKEIIRKIEEYAKSIGKTHVFLEDASYVKWKDIMFDLYVINICKNRMSYYNELGYFSDIETEIKELNFNIKELYDIIRNNRDCDVNYVMKLYKKVKKNIKYKKSLFKIIV